ncbi:succinate dehydrogenase, hydrophobic membrane anchor protein [Rhizobiales bacterium 3FA27D7]|jgi:succinate dehydrogenase / fumarate reductase membrane anchor subunit|uniref:succinate dehydrogenase, hydrophobic membrane anchor protein n=1 Tax=Mesorhizobium sp. 2RAF21 TaxID=3232995 RepID=UPI0010F8E7ED
MRRFRIQTPLGRAVGLGSAKSGFGHWWSERITAVALVLPAIWFAASLIAHSGSDYGTFILWLREPTNTALMVLLLVTLFWHAALGLQVVIEDYVHSVAKIWALIVMRFACFALAAVGIIATFRIALGA